jgi:diguanylate cyclase (GGDEF)-like protein
MVLDIRSFWLIGGICSFGFGFLLLLVRRTYPASLSRMLSYCGTASICLGAGWAILFEGPSWGRFAFLVLSRTLLALCLSLQYRAVTEITRRPASNAWVAGPPLLVFTVCTWFSYAQQNLTALVILFSLIQIAMMILLVRSLLGVDEDRRPFVDVLVAAAYSLFIASTSLVVLSVLWNSHLSPNYDFNNSLSIYNNLLAICVFLTAFSMYPVMASERLNWELKIQAMRDPLTGLYNRRAFEEIAFREIAGASRTGLSLSVMVFDIDHFKAVNDKHGHSAGDALLKLVADTLRRGLRDEDFLCRWGGDEFCALLPRANRDHAQDIAERALRLINQLTFSNHGKVIGIEISIGIVTDEDHSRNLSSLVDLADAALYQAKQEGRNRIIFAAEESSEGARTGWRGHGSVGAMRSSIT